MFASGVGGRTEGAKKEEADLVGVFSRSTRRFVFHRRRVRGFARREEARRVRLLSNYLRRRWRKQFLSFPEVEMLSL